MRCNGRRQEFETSSVTPEVRRQSVLVTRVYWQTWEDLIGSLCLTSIDVRISPEHFSVRGPVHELSDQQIYLIPLREVGIPHALSVEELKRYRSAAGLVPLDFGDYLTILSWTHFLVRDSNYALVSIDTPFAEKAGETLYPYFTSVKRKRGWERRLELLPESEALHEKTCFFGRKR